MKKRYKMSRRASKRKFRKGVEKTHYFNLGRPLFRGGIRM